MLDLNDVIATPVAPGTKGLPASAVGLPLKAIADQGWNVLDDDVPLPACVLKRSALDHNRATMGKFLAQHGLAIAPHGKTTMAPQLFDEQFADGAWGLTAATPVHAMLYRQVGVQRILYANQLVDPLAIDWVADELERDPAFELLSLIDSSEGLSLLVEQLRTRGLGRPFDVMLEVGMPGRRTGVRNSHEAIALAREIAAAAPFVRLRGVEAFEGAVPINRDGAAEVERLLAVVIRVVGGLEDAGLIADKPIVTVGGSAFFRTVAARLRAALANRCEIILRSGCYLTNDHGTYMHCAAVDIGGDPLPEPLRPALELWGYVQSIPEPGLAFLTIGKRDISYDIEMPIPILYSPRAGREVLPLGEGFRVMSLNDQHAYLAVPDGHPLKIGDRVALGCSHPCTTFDKWRVILVVNDQYDVIGGVATFF